MRESHPNLLVSLLPSIIMLTFQVELEITDPAPRLVPAIGIDRRAKEILQQLAQDRPQDRRAPPEDPVAPIVQKGVLKLAVIPKNASLRMVLLV
ncbi:hypothetical protein [Caldalkalibacillus thermarum]|uniref:hypothetical protein n=1 Tax=Caldalkalibacillus thermarum TaxID=296745 RepID=UPI00166ECAFB|nr:hypothetical protein [Caldalkalibacillus thermarum]